MNPGKLRHSITIQRPSGYTGPDGVYVPAWTLFKQCLAAVTTPSVAQFRASSRELGDGQYTTRRTSWLVRIRHDKDVASAMRVLWLDHVFEIDGMTADTENASYMYLHCYEVTPASQGFGLIDSRPQIKLSYAGTALTNGATLALANARGPGQTDYTFTIDNDGVGALGITTPLTLTATDPSITITAQPPTSIAIGGSGTFTLSITPTAVGSFTGTIDIISDDWVNGTFSIPFTLTAQEAFELVYGGATYHSGDTINIGTYPAGVTQLWPGVVIWNAGNVSLSALSYAGSASPMRVNIPATSPTTMAAGYSWPWSGLSVSAPGAPGPTTGWVEVSSNDISTPFRVNLTATII